MTSRLLSLARRTAEYLGSLVGLLVTRTAALAFLLSGLHLLVVPLAPARADVAGAMDSYFSDMGAAANVTGPTAYQGQSAGYYSLGNVWTRFPQKNVYPLNLQLPNARAGCGGIDIFTGSFSFVNAGEIVAMLKAVANNAVGFAFKLAIDTVCPECSKIMEEMRQAAQLMNNASINSCETAQALVGGVWPKSDAADRSICESIGNSKGIFSDWAASKHGCGNKGERTSTTNAGAADPAWGEVIPGVPRNYTWHVLKKSPFFSPGGSFDRQLAQYMMTMVGTIVYVPPTDGGAGEFKPIPGDTSTELVTAILDGTVGSPVRIWQCDAAESLPGAGTDACINPTLVPLSVPAANALRPRVAAMIASIADKIRTDTAITTAEQSLLQVSSLPLYKILTVQAAYTRSLPNDDRQTLAEITAIDLVFAILEQLTSEVGKSRNGFIAADESKIAQWHDQIRSARQQLSDREQKTQAKVSAVLQIVQRTAFIESVLQNTMSPGMTASLDWSRGVAQRGLN